MSAKQARPTARRPAARGRRGPIVAERLLVVGVGLIGGSAALALRAAGRVGEVVGLGRGRESLEIARRRGIVDRATTDPAAAAAGVDLVLLAVPVGSIEAAAEALRPYLPAGALVTDAGSVKAPVVASLERIFAGHCPVVGAHPVAGSDASGPGAARDDLFRGHLCLLTPTSATDDAALARVRALWEATGAVVEELDPSVHDALLARVSHMPHLVAYALVAAAASRQIDGRDPLAYAGSGFRDTTRIAASSPEMWRDVAVANRSAVLEALAEFRGALGELEEAVRSGDRERIERILGRAAACRRALEKRP